MNTAMELPQNKQNTIEIVTPHKLTIAILIREYCNFRDSDEFREQEDEALKAKYRRDFSVLMLKLLQSPDLDLEELRCILMSTKYRIHKNLIDSFDKSLLNLYNKGTGSLLDVIDSLNRTTFNENISPESMSLSYVNKSSIVGYFLRRLIVNFDKLTFSEVTTVYLTLRKYYEDWQRAMQANAQNGAENHRDDNNTHGDWYADKEQWSRRQAELFIATQAALLMNNEEKALPPIELQSRITDLLKSNPSLPEAHFLSYLNYSRVKEFCGAIASLYHSFDKNPLSSSREDKTKVYRFAALNLAILHYNFGHKEEALASLKEAIKKSQIANDNVCLQHALCWLYRLTPGNKEKLMEHSVSKSCELNLSYTTSLGVQTFVQHACLISGQPNQIFDTLIKSDIINCANVLHDLMSNSYAIKAALWQYYGKTEMCSLWSQLLFYVNIDSNDSKAFYCEGFCLALCNVSNHLLLQGDYALVHTILGFAKERFPNEPISYIWMLCENLFIFTRSMYHENWREAESAAQKIVVVNKWEGYLRLAELYYYKEDYSEAEKFINILMTRYQNCAIQKSSSYKLKMHYYIRARILLAEVYFSSRFPDKISPGILNLLNECLVETERHYLDYHSAMIHLHIANVQLNLGLAGDALKILDKCLVQILAHGGNFDRARATLLYVKCLLAHSTRDDFSARKSVILKSAEMLHKVKENFKIVEAYSRVKDVLYFQAQLYDALDMPNERNKCALEFRLLCEERTTKNDSTLLKFL